MTYEEVKVFVSDYQKERIRNSNGNIKLTFTYEDLISPGNGSLFLTNAQLGKIRDAIMMKKGVTLTLSNSQVKYNVKSGGFLQALLPFLPLASAVIPEIIKAVAGKGLYLKRGGRIFKITPFVKEEKNRGGLFDRDGFFDGNGLYLRNGRGILTELFGDEPVLRDSLKTI